MAELDNISSYLSESDLRRQTDFFLGLLDEVEKKAESMADKFKNFKFNFGGEGTGGGAAGGTKKTSDDFKELELTTAKYQKILAALADQIDKLTDKQKKQLKVLDDQYRKEEAARASAKEVVGLIQKQISAEAKLEVSRTQAAEALAKSNIELKRQADLNKANAAIQATEEGSVKRLEAVRARLRLIQTNLNTTTEEGRKKSEAYIRMIDKIGVEIKKNSDKLTQQKINIGNYGEVVEGLAPGINQLRDAWIDAGKKAQQFAIDLGEGHPAAQAARQEFEALDQIFKDPKFLNIAAKNGGAKQELTALTKVAMNLEDKLGRDNAMVIELKNYLGGLKDAIGDMNDEIRALASDTRTFDLMTGSIKTLVAMYQVAAGVVGLFNDDQEETAQITKNLVAVQNIAMGVSEVANEITNKSTAAGKAWIFIKKQMNILTADGTTVTQRFNAALKLSLIGLAITAIYKLASAFGSSGDEAKEAADQIINYNNAMEEAIRRETELRKIRIQKSTWGTDISDLQKRVDLMKASGKTGKEMYEAEKALATKRAELATAPFMVWDDTLNKQVLQIKKFEEAHATTFTKLSELDGQLADYDYKINNEKNKKKREGLELTKKIIQSEYNLTKTSYEMLEAEIIEYYDAVNAVKLVDANRQKELDDKAKERADKKKEDDKKREEDRISKAIDRENKKNEMLFAIAENNINREIRNNEKIVNNDYATAEDRFEALSLMYRAKNALAAVNYQKETADEIRFENGKRVVIKKSAEEILLAQQNYDDALIQAAEETDETILAIKKKTYEDAAESAEESFNLMDKFVGDVATEAEIERERKKQEALAQLLSDFKRKKIKTVEEYEAKKAALELNYGLKSLADDVLVLQERISVAEQYGKDTTDLERELARKRMEISDKLRQTEEDNARRAFQTKKDLKEAEKRLFAESQTFLISLINGRFDAEKNRIQQSIDDNERRTQLLIQNVANEQITEQEKAAKITVIEKVAAAEKEKLEMRQRAIDYRKAVFNKAVQVAQVTGETIKTLTAIRLQAALARAQAAIIAAQAVANPLLIPAAGAATAAAAAVQAQVGFAIGTGALQLAAILATPIPRYAEGREGGIAEWAITGDGGKREVIEKKTGGISISPATPTLTYLDEGDTVHPSILDYLMKSGAFEEVMNELAGTDYAVIAALNTGFDKLGRIIKNKPDVTLIGDTNLKKVMKGGYNEYFA